MLHTTIQIRAALQTDASAFRDLRLEALKQSPEAFGADYATNEHAPLSFWTERLSHPADDPEQTIFFAVADATLAGMCGIRCYIESGFTVYGVEPQAICYAGRCYDELLMSRLVQPACADGQAEALARSGGVH